MPLYLLLRPGLLVCHCLLVQANHRLQVGHNSRSSLPLTHLFGLLLGSTPRIMTSVLTSQGVVLATAMLFSSTVLYLAFSKQKTSPTPRVTRNEDFQSPDQTLRSCLRSEEKRRERRKKKEKKRVQFAENVKETKGNGEEYRREKENSWFARQKLEQEQEREKERKSSSPRARNDSFSCRNEIQQAAAVNGMPANRIALYNGILRDRLHRMECSSY